MTVPHRPRLKSLSACLPEDLIRQAQDDARALGAGSGTTEIIKTAFAAMHRQVAVQTMAQSIDEFYGGEDVPLPLGVHRSSRRGPAPSAVTPHD